VPKTIAPRLDFYTAPDGHTEATYQVQTGAQTREVTLAEQRAEQRDR
jgi:hypothetical protein